MWRVPVFGTIALGCASGGPTVADKTVDPCADFAAYACGRARLATRDFSKSIVTLKEITDQIAASRLYTDHPSATFVKAFVDRCQDPQARALGMPELRAKLDELGRASTIEQFATELGVLGIENTDVLLRLAVAWDAALDRPFVANISLAAAGLAPSAYARYPDAVADLRQHWRTLASRSGAISKDEVDAALRVDAQLATQQSKPRNPSSSAALQVLPRFDQDARAGARFPWAAYLAPFKLTEKANLVSVDGRLVEAVDRLFEMPLPDLKSYARMAVLERWLGHASSPGPTYDEEIRYHWDASLRNPPLGAVCANMLLGDLGPIVAEAYYRRMVNTPSERIARQVFTDLRGRFVRRLRVAPWLDDVTRAEAIAKVQRTTVAFIGDAPARNMRALAVRGGSFLAMVRQARAWDASEDYRLIGTMPNPTFDPWLGVAAYHPVLNAIWVSQPILMPPFLQPAPFYAASFGAMGSTLGHEITHVLEPADGATITAGRAETWPTTVATAYQERVACVQRQFGVWEPDAGRTLDERNTSMENVADLTGATLALEEMEAEASRLSPSPSFAERRREFFLGYAQALCGSPEKLAFLTDPHGSPRARINGVVANLPAFAETFSCAPGKPLAPVHRCTVW